MSASQQLYLGGFARTGPSSSKEVARALCPTGDYAIDGDVDLHDSAFLEYCMTGPEGYCYNTPAGCCAADPDGDADLDRADWTLFKERC